VAAAPWRLAGANGTDRIDAALTPEEATASGRSFGLSLDLRALKPPALHNDIGYVGFADAGSSYYYSRTRLSATGTLTVDGRELPVDGIAWFDHQWGDFVSVGSGGWNWFAINLDDGTDITVSQVLDEHAVPILVYGTRVAPDGTITHIRDDQLGISSGESPWTSPRTNRTWTQGWQLNISQETFGPANDQLTLVSTVRDQELDTRATTGVVYWEGSQVVSGELGVTFDPDTGNQLTGTKVAGRAYVEMTRYDALSN
jgi:predicted secreted hydrolase